jgi:hypothetical protein
MIIRLALRSLLMHPIRTLVLACGFGLGVGVMAMLLGVGEVILEQARSPALSGAGDVVISSATGQVPSARWILSSAPGLSDDDDRVAAVSPSRRATLYLVKNGGTLPIRAQGGIPSLERAVGDRETSRVDGWIDAPSDGAWASPDPAAALLELDRFHPIPDVPARAESWAEWLYFNGREGDTRFYLTFMVGGRKGREEREAGVRLQLDRGSQRSSFSARHVVNEAEILSHAPNITMGSNRVRLEGMRYHITFDLPAEGDDNGRAIGDIFIDASAGHALPPLTIRGAAGWVSGYVVPVMSGRLTGHINVGRAPIVFTNGAGYHDHNWGFWKDVSWRWGQVQHGDLSLIYGRIFPPADAADPERMPGFLSAIDRDGPVGYATEVTIEETNDPATGQPRTIAVSGRGSNVDLRMELSVESTITTRTGSYLFGGDMDFLQMRARYRVRGRAGDRDIDFSAPGSAETFRSR